MKHAAILILDDGKSRRSIALDRDMSIGRDSSCDIAVDHPTLSRLHAKVTMSNDQWKLTDLGSQNGSRVGGTRVQGSAPLTDGTPVRFGRVRAWFFDSAAPDGWQPPQATVDCVSMVCVCGAPGWIPKHARGLSVQCKSCGKELSSLADEAEPAGQCAACHCEITAGEPSHACPSCAATMHTTCWQEVGGCATYGCDQVTAVPESGAADDASAEPEPTDSQQWPSADAADIKPLIAAVVLLGLLGMISFGVPAIAVGVYHAVAGDRHRLGNRRWMLVASALLLGSMGFYLSAHRWFP